MFLPKVPSDRKDIQESNSSILAVDTMILGEAPEERLLFE